MWDIEEELLRYINLVDDRGDKIFLGENNEKKIEDISRDIVEADKKIITEYKDKISRLNLMKIVQEEREKKIIQSFIKIIDSVEWVIKSGEVFDDNNSGLSKSFGALKKIINRECENIKIIKTGEEGELYNENYHTCVGYKSDKNMSDDVIFQVLRYGYIYKNKIVRQAEVIVVKNIVEEKNEPNRN